MAAPPVLTFTSVQFFSLGNVRVFILLPSPRRVHAVAGKTVKALVKGS